MDGDTWIRLAVATLTLPAALWGFVTTWRDENDLTRVDSQGMPRQTTGIYTPREGALNPLPYRIFFAFMGAVLYVAFAWTMALLAALALFVLWLIAALIPGINPPGA